MNRSLKLTAKFAGCILLIAVSRFASAGSSAPAVNQDRCATKYAPNDPVIALYEETAKLKPLVPSKWETVATKGLNFNFETASSTNQDVVVRVTSLPDAQKEALIAQQVAKGLTKIAARATITVLLSLGFPFNASLCARPDNSLYINLVGTGGAAGQNGKIDIKPDANSISVTGVIAGGQIDGSVQVQK